MPLAAGSLGWRSERLFLLAVALVVVFETASCGSSGAWRPACLCAHTRVAIRERMRKKLLFVTNVPRSFWLGREVEARDTFVHRDGSDEQGVEAR